MPTAPGVALFVANLLGEVLADERMAIEEVFAVVGSEFNCHETKIAKERNRGVPVFINKWLDGCLTDARINSRCKQRFGEARNDGRFSQCGDATGIGRAVEQAKHSQDGELARAEVAALGKPVFEGGEHFEGRAALFLAVGFLKLNQVTAANVAAVRAGEEAAQQVDREAWPSTSWLAARSSLSSGLIS